MKGFKGLLIVFIFSFLFSGCTSDTGDNDSPRAVLKDNPNADFFVFEDVVYMNVTDIDWIKELTLKEGKVLGKINKTGVKKDFKDWNATTLVVDTEVYELEGRNDIVLVKVDNKYIPYLKYLEG